MESRVPRPCRHGGCRVLTTEGYCEKHKPTANAGRLSSSKRGYGYKWRKARERHLQLYPFCEECKRQGKPSVLATDVDHIVPHKGEPKQKHTNRFDNMRLYGNQKASGITSRRFYFSLNKKSPALNREREKILFILF